MTSWLPDISRGSGPLYIQLADEIEKAVSAGTLSGGEKLPPQRNLAFDVGVTLGTVTRAYSLLKERGIATGEVGRGTYIRSPDSEFGSTAPAPRRYNGLPAEAEPSWTLMNSTSAPDVGQASVIARIMAELAAEDAVMVTDYVRHIPDNWREAGREWIASKHWSPETANTLPTMGAHAALTATISAVTTAGDRIAFEELTYPATVRASILMGRRPVKMRSTDQGLDPDEFERLCAQQHPKLAIIVSTFNNPTLTTMPLENRQKIVESARRHNVLIIDDDTYGVLHPDPPPPLAALAPERVFHITSMSKSVAAGLRAGWVTCPAGYLSRVLNAHRLVTGGMPRAMQEIAARMVMRGEANRIRDLVKAEQAIRIAKARAAFAGFTFKSDPDCPFLWLRLPEPWVPSTFCKAASARHVIVEEADEFKVGQMERSVPFVRIALTGALPASGVDEGLGVLRDLLHHPELAYDSSE